MGRLIDENDVVDALKKVASFFPYRIPGKGETYDKYNEAWNDAMGRAEMEIESLPSAQPSRIEQALHGKTPEEQYKILYQLMFEYANTFNDARRAVIDWLGE